MSNTTHDITFQILDWASANKDVGDNVEKYIVRLFGMTTDKKTIYVEVTNFTPYFYVEIPDNWTKIHVGSLITAIKEKLYPKSFRERKVVASIVRMKKFYGFTADKLFNFVRLVFDDSNTMRQYSYIFDRVIQIPQLGVRRKFQIYEANIEPHIRLMHIRDIRACGWVTLEAGKYEIINKSDIETSCNINVIADYTAINPHTEKDSDIQPFTIAAIDIECISEDTNFPQASRDGDKIIMIATTFSRYGEESCYYKHAVVLGTCNKIPDADVVSCGNEKELLVEWAKMIKRTDPDFVIGWNNFGFDEKYIKDRCIKHNILPRVSCISRLNTEPAEFVEKKLQSSALGDNLLCYFNKIGRINMDLMCVVRKDYSLPSYKLNFVASYFFREIVDKFEHINTNTLITTKTTKGINVGQYTTIIYNDGVTDYEHMEGKKFRILEITPTTVLVGGHIDINSLNMKHKIYWCRVKDDVEPQEIKKKFEGTIEERTELVAYNFQDCMLCNMLIEKLSIITNNIGMANVCNVPLYYLFIRGQGVKVFSLVSKKCRQLKHLIKVVKKKKSELTPEQEKEYKAYQKYNDFYGSHKSEAPANVSDENEDNVGFEGALVIEPVPGVYLDPTIVLDYGSLYPSSMIYKNLSHECFVTDESYKDYDEYDFTTITYNNLDGSPAKPCVFAKKKNGDMGILPIILSELLSARKAVRKLEESEKDPFKKKVLNGLQLAYKVTANSLYGQTGAPTSPIYMKEIAASTTATGREMLQFSCNFVENIFSKIVNYALGENICEQKLSSGSNDPHDKEKYMKFIKHAYKLKKNESFINAFNGSTSKEDFFEKVYDEINETLHGYRITPKIIYGDTDSVFYNPNIRSVETGKILRDKSALCMALKLGPLSSVLICLLLDPPMRQEYEKVMYPIIFLSKKRYVGNLYTNSPDKFFQKCMGIVLKRRDNANIVKIVCGGIVDYIINKHDPKGAIKFTREALMNIMTGKYSLDKFVITKTLKQNYKNRDSIAHAVLADRMRKRDPGSAPNSNDRIPYVFVVPSGPVHLQGDRIEHLDYVKKHGLKIDYLFYVTNQIMKPTLQFLNLISDNPKKIFDRVIMIETNVRHGLKPVTAWY